MLGGWVYIMSNKPRGTLYVGVTSDLGRRIWQHQEGKIDGFTKQYGLKRLVFTERYELITQAIQRENLIKHWTRAWKIELIQSLNPQWRDLYDSLI